LPTLAAVCMGVGAWAVYAGMYFLTKSNVISLIPSILIAVVIYFVLLILFKGINEEELKAMPKGYMLVRLAKKCRLM